MEFKGFLLLEQQEFFAEKVGNIQTRIIDLLDNESQIGLRKLMEEASDIINMIRKLLHSDFSGKYLKYLKVLQKCAVAIAKCIDDKDDLSSVLQSAKVEINNLLAKLGVPQNKLDEE